MRLDFSTLFTMEEKLMKAWQGIIGAGMILFLSGGMCRGEVFLVDLGTEASFRGDGIATREHTT